MGLSLEVGILADLRENDKEGYEYWKQQFQTLNEFLRASGLPAHTEPEDCEVWGCDMFGYSGLHYLRRVAAHLDVAGHIPPPGGEDAAKDETLLNYYRYAEEDGANLAKRLFVRSPKFRLSFNHLILHSDDEGLYIPMAFEKVLFPPSDFGISGGIIGSSVGLLKECELLASRLEIPPDVTYDSEEVYKAADLQGQADVRWKKYGRESFTCLHLMRACRQSIKTGAAVVFT